MQDNPFAHLMPPSGASPGGQIFTLPKDPTKEASAAAELRNRNLAAQETQLRIAKMQQEAAQTEADKALTATSTAHGPDYLKSLPGSLAEQVKMIAEGRLGVPASSLRSPYWQNMMQHVANYDPSFDQVDYNARLNTRKDFTAGKSAQNIKALNTAIGHVGQLADQISGTASHGGFPLATTVNRAVNAYERSSGDPGITNYEQTAGAVASELTQVFRGSGGAEADVKRYLGELNSNASEAQKRAAIQNIAGLLNSRLQAIGDQYQKGMGTASQPLQLLDDHAQKVMAALGGGMPGASPPGSPPSAPPPGTPPGGTGGPGPGPGAPGPNDMLLFNDQAAPVTGARMSPQQEAQIGAALRSGDRAGAIGLFQQFTGNPATAATVKGVDDAIKAFRSNPNARVAVNYGNVDAAAQAADDAKRYGGRLPQAMAERANASGADVTARALSNGVLAGIPDYAAGIFSGSTDLERARTQADARLSPTNSFMSNVIGGAGGTMLGEMGAGRALGALGKVAPKLAGLERFAPLVGDIGYGATSGYTSAGPGDGATSTLLGGAAGAAGGVFGRQVLGPALALPFRKVAESRGVIPTAPSAADSAVMSAAKKQGLDDIRGSLSQAAADNLPMSLADTGAPLNSLAGAAVRRSPAVDQLAQSTLLRRSRGQVDRFGDAITNNLGPTTDIAAQSLALAKKAKADAGPLYDAFRAEPPVGTPNIDSILNTPFGQKSLNEAKTIIANRRQDPRAYGMRLGADGNVVLNPVPVEQHGAYAAAKAEADAAAEAVTRAESSLSREGAPEARQRYANAQANLKAATDALTAAPAADSAQVSRQFLPSTLDLVKQGMDARLYRPENTDAFGRLNLKGPASSELPLKNDLLKELDSLYPNTYPQARSAYGGPMQSRDALNLGKDAASMRPDELRIGLQGKSPEQLSQIQLGHRSELVNRAEKMRYSGGDPHQALLDSSAAEQRLAAIEGADNPGVANLLRIRDTERKLSRSTNDVLGNSKTAQRQIADQSFADGELPQMVFDAGVNLATGQVPTGLLLKKGVGSAIKDAWTMGLGKKAVAKADAMAPTLLNTDAKESLSKLDSLFNDAELRQRYVDAYNRRVGRPLGMFGSSVGAALASLAQ